MGMLAKCYFIASHECGPKAGHTISEMTENGHYFFIKQAAHACT